MPEVNYKQVMSEIKCLNLSDQLLVSSSSSQYDLWGTDLLGAEGCTDGDEVVSGIPPSGSP